jgi:hypothetical protein
VTSAAFNRRNYIMLKDKLSWIATAVTVGLMFSAIVWLQPIILTLQPTYRCAAAIGAIVASVGVYRLFAEGLIWLFGKSIFLRKFILGTGFLEGTWVGHYLHEGQHRLTIEYINQTTGVTVIHGREFDAAGNTRASWTSDTVSIDISRLQLIYAYTCKVFDRKHVQEGLGVFVIVCETAGGPPNKLDGYAVDLIDGQRDPNTEYKISNRPVSDAEALTNAKKLFGVT